MGMLPGGNPVTTALNLPLPPEPPPPAPNGNPFLTDPPPVDPMDPGERFVMTPIAPTAVGQPQPAAINIPIQPQSISQPAAIEPAYILRQLHQMKTLTAEKNVTSKDFLIKRGLAVSVEGYLLLTPKGVTYLADFGLL